uniref:Transmembrane protein n=1 Tax=Meloidogyne floridensis TaxID=298350 RepID=A0A915NXT1_9BILA
MKIYFHQFPLPIIIFLLLFISFASANFDFIVRISGTWAKLREYKWLVSVEPKERFECLMINKDNIKYEGKFFKENETNKDMLFNFKISGSKEGGWYLECELNKPPFIEQLLPNLEKQKIKRPLYELGTNVITTVSFLNNPEADINRNDEKLKEALKAIQHLSGKEYNIRSIQYSMNYEEILKMFLVQSWREYKYGIIYVKLYNIKLIFNNLINRPENDEIRKQLLDMIYDIYKKIVKIEMELQNESRGRTEQQPATQQKEIKMFTQNELIDVLSTDSNSQQLGNTPNNQLNETISPSFHPGSSSIKQPIHANQLPNIQHENITHRPHSIPLHNPNTNLQHSRQIMQQNLAIGLTSNHPRPNVPTITGSDYMQLQNLNRNFRPSSSQINQNPVQYQFLSQRFPSPGLGKSGMISFNQIPANRTQSENRPISLPQPLQKPIQHHGQTIQQQSTQQHPLPNIGSSNANIFKPHALPNSPLFQQLPKRTSTSYFNAAGGVGQLHNIRGSSSSTPNQHQMFPPGFEQTIARKNEIFNKNSNVYSGQTLHEIQQLRQQQSKQFGIQHSILIPGQFQHSGQGTLQQQTLNSEQYLQQFNRQLQKDVQNPFQQQPPSQQNTGTSSQKNYSDLLAKQNSGAENPNTSTQQMADNLNKGWSCKVSALIGIIINNLIYKNNRLSKILSQKY